MVTAYVGLIIIIGCSMVCNASVILRSMLIDKP